MKYSNQLSEKTQNFEWSSQFEPEESSAKYYQRSSPPSIGRKAGILQNVRKTDKTGQQIRPLSYEHVSQTTEDRIYS
jgi:hypothetical protein